MAGVRLGGFHDRLGYKARPAFRIGDLHPDGQVRCQCSRRANADRPQQALGIGRLAAGQHQVGKENTQKIESKHINLRTRIKRFMRRTLCFSKTERMHDLVIGLFINRYEFGRPL